MSAACFELLAGSLNGATDALLIAHGFTLDMWSAWCAAVS
jgi:hypothetical protein